jgi:hypothetical protein
VEGIADRGGRMLMNPEKHGKRPAELAPKEDGVPPDPVILRRGVPADNCSLRERLEARIHVLNQRLQGKHAPFRVRVF